MPRRPHRPVDAKPSFPALEERVLERWQETRVFERSVEQRAGAPVWTFYDGPPTANGLPGSHHVLARVFKDFFPRYRTMTGHFVPRKAGWDCHGLPVELEVEKELGVSSKEEIEEFGIAEFNERCRESVFRYVDAWKRLTERIGFWVDMDDAYATLENDYIESVWWSLRRLWDKDALFEGHKVVPYCPRCGTALSSHEVAQGYKDVEDPSVYVKLQVLATDRGAPLEEGDNLLVWTTTPWTLVSNAAVAVGPDIEYVRARLGDDILVLAAERVEPVLGEGAEVLDRFPGTAIEGTRYAPPFPFITDYGPRGHTVLAADFVTTDEGTGLVHTAIAFGEDDFRLGEQYGITYQNAVKLDGTYDERVTDYAGMFVKDADAQIVEDLRERGQLFRSETHVHSYPHCWRCGTPLLYYAKASWYIATSRHRDELLASNERVNWYPEHIKHGRFGRWLEGNVDWALSRDRYWGTPLPVWECDASDCDEQDCIGSIADLRERAGDVPDDLHRPYIDDVTWGCRAEGCEGTMRRVKAVIDTWYDSGAMPFAQFHYPFENQDLFAERFPADYICEAIDQTRGWFYTLLAESTLLFGDTSFRNCVCLGHIQDPQGYKMSKSRGNTVDPWDVIDSHGADAFRWYYLAAQQPWTGYRFSVETVGESVRQFLLTLWNTYAFYVLYANTESFDPADRPPAGERTDLDRWALSRLQSTVAEVRERLDDFDATGGGQALAAWVDELSNWYVRLSRRRFWRGDRAALSTLYECLLTTVEMLAPYIPFAADEIYDNLRGGRDDLPDSVHLRDYPAVDHALRDPALEAEMALVRDVVELGRSARAQSKVKLRQPLSRAIAHVSDDGRAAVERHEQLIAAELNVKHVELVADEASMVEYTVQPNLPVVGRRFGRSVPQVKAALAALDGAEVARRLAAGEPVRISIEGHDHELSADDVLLKSSPRAGFEFASRGDLAVAADLEIDEPLRREGLAREIVHAVQAARKDAGFEVTDRITLKLRGDEQIYAAATEHEPYLAEETLALKVELHDDGAGGDLEIDGHPVAIEVERVDS
jgi:isoleucyl-tRNA synthetase